MTAASSSGLVVRLAAAARPSAHSHHAPGCSSRGNLMAKSSPARARDARARRARDERGDDTMNPRRRSAVATVRRSGRRGRARPTSSCVVVTDTAGTRHVHGRRVEVDVTGLGGGLDVVVTRREVTRRWLGCRRRRRRVRGRRGGRRRSRRWARDRIPRWLGGPSPSQNAHPSIEPGRWLAVAGAVVRVLPLAAAGGVPVRPVRPRRRSVGARRRLRLAGDAADEAAGLLVADVGAARNTSNPFLIGCGAQRTFTPPPSSAEVDDDRDVLVVVAFTVGVIGTRRGTWQTRAANARATPNTSQRRTDTTTPYRLNG